MKSRIYKNTYAICCYIAIALLLLGCSSANVTVLGVKEFQFPKTARDKQITEKITFKSDGVFQFSKDAPGMITGSIISEDSSLTKFALVSITEKKEDYRNETWSNFYADRHGHFKIMNIPYGNYKVASSNVDAYLTVKQNIIITQEDQDIKLRIELTPIPAEED